MPHPRIGTCSWNYPSWEGLVYRQGQQPGPALLREYATRFDCVEIDRWFWSLGRSGKAGLPSPSDAAAYREAVGDGFRFAVKAPNALTLTHEYARRKDDPLVANPHFLSRSLLGEFLDRIEAMHDVLGPILFQFEYLNRKKVPSRAAFLDQVAAFARELPPGFTYGVEVRNPPWVDAEHLTLLKDVGLIPVLISGYWMPPLEELFERHRKQLLGFDTIVLRLMGEDRGKIEETTGKVWNRIVEPHDAELGAVAGILVSISRAGRTPFLFVNNHYEGCAPLTITRLLDRLEAEIGAENPA